MNIPRDISVFILLFLVSITLPHKVFAALRTWNGSGSSLWSNPSNWTGGVPVGGDDITINNGTFQPVYDGSLASVVNFTINSGTLDLGSFALSITGNSNFAGGAITNGGSINCTGTSTTFAGGCTFAANVPVTVNSSNVYFNGATFNGTVNATKTGASSNTSTGSNTFNSAVTITNAGTNSMIFSGGNTFNGITAIIASNTSYIVFGNASRDIFGNDVTFTSSGTGTQIYVGYIDGGGNGTLLNGNVTINSTGTSAGISFGSYWASTSANGIITLAAGKTISIGGGGFTSGMLILRRFHSFDPITLVSSANIQLGAYTTFDGNVDFTFGNIDFYTATYNGSAKFTKTANVDNACTGGDVFNGPVIYNNQSANKFDIGYSIPNTYNGNISFGSTGTGTIFIGRGVTGGANIAPGYSMGISPLGFSAGWLRLYNVSQTDNLSLSLGAGANFVVRNSSLAGNSSITAGNIDLGTTVFGTNTSNSLDFTQLAGTGGSACYGGNTFKGPVTFGENDNSGINGAGWRLQYTEGDTFEDDATFFRYANSKYFLVAFTPGTTTYFGGSLICTGNGSGSFVNTAFGGNGAAGGKIEFNGSKTGCAFTHLSPPVARSASNIVINKTAGSTVQLNFNLTIVAGTPSLEMKSGTFIVPSTVTLTGAAAQFIASGGDLQIARLANPQPELQGAYSITGGTVTLNGAGDQTLRTSASGSSTYYSVVLTNSGNKTITGLTTINGDLSVSGSAIFPNTNSSFIQAESKTFTYSSSGSTTIKAATPITIGNFVQSAGTFNDAGNTITVSGGTWSRSGGTFTTTGTTVFSKASSQTIGGTISSTFNNLTISNSSGDVSLTGGIGVDVTVANTLNFSNGKVILGISNLIISSGNAITGYNSSKFIVTDNTGYLQINSLSASRDFPIGPGLSSYNPINIVNSGGVGNFNARVCGYLNNTGTCTGGTAETGYAVDRTWTINTSSGSPNAVVKFVWDITTDELTYFNNTNCAVSRYDGSAWNDFSLGNATNEVSIGANYYSQSATGVSSFSPFKVKSPSPPLPVELLYFIAEWCENNSKVKLEWVTATEINNDYFDIERSTDGINFCAIMKVSGAGNSNTIINYSKFDENPIFDKVSYYRLKQVDLDGSFFYSDLVALNISEGIEIVNIWPNPSIDKISILATVSENSELKLRVIDEKGVIVKERELEALKGVTIISVNTEYLSSGLYFVRLESESGAFYNQKQFIVSGKF